MDGTSRPSVLASVILLFVIVGVPIAGQQRKIVHGYDITINDAPYLATIQARMNATYWKNICGATIISPLWLLTAAHCITMSEDLPDKRVVTSRDVYFGHGVQHQVRRFIPHPGYRSDHRKGDVGLVEMERPIAFDESTGAAKLPAGPIRAGDVCLTNGFGRLAYKGDSPRNLQRIRMVVLDDSYCAEMSDIFQAPSMFCAGGYNGALGGFCSGDSGSSTICDGYVSGIVSYKRFCDEDMPDYFANVYTYVPWIRAQTGL